MNADDLDRLSAIAPQRHDRPPLFTAGEREALLAEAISGHRGSRPRTARRPVRTWAWRLAPLVAAGTAAAVAVAVSGGTPGLARHGRLAAGAGRPAAPQASTVAYVTQHVRAALARQHSGALRFTFTDSFGVWRDIEDLNSGANRETFIGASDGAVQADYSSTGRGRAGTYTVVYYPVRGWWTDKGAVAGPASGFSAPSLRRQLAAGALVRVGNGTVDGQAAIHLRYAKTSFTQKGKKYYLGGTTDLWVSAATFLPIRETGTKGKWTADFAWSAQPPKAAQLTAVPPAGFAHLNGPPASLLKPGGGAGTKG